MLSAGDLRHRVRIEYPVETQDQTDGSISVEWTTLATVWAKITHSSARDLIAAQSEDSKVMGRVVIRFRDDIADNMRLYHISKNQYYNIEGLLSDKESGLEYITIPVSEGLKYQ